MLASLAVASTYVHGDALIKKPTLATRVNILLPQARICGVCNAGEHMHSDKFIEHQPHLTPMMTDVG